MASVYLGEIGRNLVLGFEDPQDHQNIPVYSGVLVGPMANRVRDGRVRIGQADHQMPLNEKDRTTLHSGPTGIHAQDWEVTAQSTDAASLTLELRDGDQGLPGKRTLTAQYRLEANAIVLEIKARTDQTTPMNIAAHPYWKLDEEATIHGHQLHLPCAHYLPTDAHNLPTGEIAPVHGTPFDFLVSKNVPLTPDIDVNFCLSDAPAASPRLAARLTGATGVTLDLETDASGLQVYNGAHLPSIPNVLTDGADLRPYGGIALEPQFWPDALSHPHFPSVILNPGDTWRQTTRYRLSSGTE